MSGRENGARKPRDVKREVLSKEAEAMAREYFTRRCVRYATSVGEMTHAMVDGFAGEALEVARAFEARLAEER